MADFDLKIKALSNQIDSITKDYNDLLIAYADARDFTEKFLNCCERHGISTVAIQEISKIIKSSVEYPFGKYGSVFADERDEGGWPSIWAVCGEMKISGGCGNTGQHQITSNAAARLVDGVYTLKDGVWKREDGKD